MQEALDNMFDIEHGEKSNIINELKRRLDTIKGRLKRKIPPSWIWRMLELARKILTLPSTLAFCHMM